MSLFLEATNTCTATDVHWLKTYSDMYVHTLLDEHTHPRVDYENSKLVLINFLFRIFNTTRTHITNLHHGFHGSVWRISCISSVCLLGLCVTTWDNYWDNNNLVRGPHLVERCNKQNKQDRILYPRSFILKDVISHSFWDFQIKHCITTAVLRLEVKTSTRGHKTSGFTEQDD